MRVLVIHWGNNGGGPKFGYEIARGLTGVDGLEVYTSYSRDNDIADLWSNIGVDAYRVRTYKNPLGLIAGLPRLLLIAVGLRKFIRQNRIEVVYSSMFSLWQSIALPFYLPSGVRFFASVHDASDHPGEEHWLKEFCRRIEIRKATAIVAYSQHVKSELEKSERTNKPIVHVPHGVDTIGGYPRQLPQGRPLRVGFFGRLAAYKGLGLFAESIELLQESSEIRYQGIVFGDGAVEDQLIQRTAAFIEWNVGWVDNADVDSIFERFDILALPYVEASQSGVLSLAVGRGVPVVATPIGGLTEQVEESGAGVVAERVDAVHVAEAINRLGSDPQLYFRVSRAGMEAAATTLSWPRVAASLAAAMATSPRN